MLLSLYNTSLWTWWEDRTVRISSVPDRTHQRLWMTPMHIIRRSFYRLKGQLQTPKVSLKLCETYQSDSIYNSSVLHRYICAIFASTLLAACSCIGRLTNSWLRVAHIMIHRTAMNPRRSNIYRLRLSYILSRLKWHGRHSHSTTDTTDILKKPTNIYRGW